MLVDKSVLTNIEDGNTRLAVDFLLDRGFQVEAVGRGDAEGSNLNKPSKPRKTGEPDERVLFRKADRHYECIIQFTMGRSDRVMPQLSMALLEARFRASKADDFYAFPVVVVDKASRALLLSAQSFAALYLTHGEALAVISEEGSSFITFDGNNETHVNPVRRGIASSHEQRLNLFSDTHQWLLKVLLAQRLPPELLSANRGPFYSGTQLAGAAGVSTVTANRFLNLLKREGYLDSLHDELKLLRLDELLSRWRSASDTGYIQRPMQFVFRDHAKSQLNDLLRETEPQTCLGFFEAAFKLGMGHVQGVTPYVYVKKLSSVPFGKAAWEAVLIADEDSHADFFVRQSAFPISTFKGAVKTNHGLCTDVIQTWLDVSQHPSRGQEQADLIYRKFLKPLFA